jgi:Transposase
MKEKLRFLGLDVHAETIVAAIAEPDGEVRSLGTIPNRMESVRKLLKKLGPVEKLRACYEAGPTGYVLYWQLGELGVQCEVIAPSVVPVKAGDRVKTDRRDAEKLARSYRSGDLTAGFPTKAPRRCAIWCVRVKPRSRTSCGLVTGLTNSCCARVNVRRLALGPGHICI